MATDEAALAQLLFASKQTLWTLLAGIGPTSAQRATGGLEWLQPSGRFGYILSVPALDETFPIRR